MKRIVFLFTLGLPLLSACPEEAPTTQDAGELDPEHRFDPDACEHLEGTARADTPARAEGVAHVQYDLAHNGGAVDLVALAPDDTPLGTVSITYDVEPGPVPRFVTEVRYREGSEEATELTRSSFVGPLIRASTRKQLGDTWSVLFWTATPEGVLQSATLAVPTTDLPNASAGVLRLPEGTFRTLQVISDATFVSSETEMATFAEENGLSAFDDSVVFRRMTTVANDNGWRTHATLRLQACEGGEAAAHEEERSLTNPNQISSSLSCTKTIELAGGAVLTTIAAYGVYTAAAEFTMGVAAVGLLTPGVGVAVVLVGAAIAIHARDSAINIAATSIAKDNFGAIVSAPLALQGDEEGAATVAEFFAPKGGSSGDPHLTTHDGEVYDFQAEGEFVLTRSASGDFELQVRQQRWDTSICPGAAVNHVLALRLGAHRVTYDVDRERRLYVDGVDLDLIDGALLFDDGTAIFKDSGERYQFWSPSGEAVRVTASSHINMWLDLPAARAGSYSGLLGNFDGDRDNDLVGTLGVLPDTTTFEDIHGPLRERWRVTDVDSLFDYDGSDGPDSFYDPSFPAVPARVETLPADRRAAGEAACVDVTNPIAYRDCVLDVGCTNDSSFADAHKDRDPQISIPVLDPILFDGWSQQGPPGNGAWMVGPDGRSVLQTVNGDPTFFVSDRDYLNVRLDGTLDPTPQGDDDFVGFVFGYQSPIAGSGGDENAFDSFVVSWKRTTQSGAEEGLELLHVHTDMTTDPVPTFWDNTLTTDVDVLAQHIGPGTGWRDKPVRFSLLYTAERIEVWLDGDLVLSLDAADSPRPFLNGRFGFYNYSQPQARYADFTVGPPTPAPVRANCELLFDASESNTINSDVTLGRMCSRYVIETRDLDVLAGGALHILPGTELRVGAARRIQVRAAATLDAIGTEDEPIRIVGTTAAKNHWGGISFLSDDVNNRLERVLITDTGAPGLFAHPYAVVVTGDANSNAGVNVEDCTFERLGDKGVVILPGGDLRTFVGNSFTDTDGVPLEVPLRMADRVDAANVFAGTDVLEPAVRVVEGATPTTELRASATWAVLDVPWRVAGQPRIADAAAVLTLPPGSRLEFEPSAALDVELGALSAIGSVAAPIVFTGVTETAGSWAGVFVRSNLDANVMEHVEVAYAGGAGGYQAQATAIHVTGDTTTPAKLTLRDSTVRNSAGSAVLVQTGATFVDDGNTYADNAGGDVVTP